MAGIGAGLWFAGVVPAQNAAPASAPDNGAMNAISAQLNQIQAALATRPAPADSALNARVATLDAQIKALGDQLGALNRRLDGIAVAAQSAKEHADAAVAAAQSAGKRADETAAAVKSVPQGTVTHSDLDALASRVAALESTIVTLSATELSRDGKQQRSASRAAPSPPRRLRAAVDRGAPFTAELTAIKAFGVDQNAVAALTPFAAGGVPTDAALGTRTCAANAEASATAARCRAVVVAAAFSAASRAMPKVSFRSRRLARRRRISSSALARLNTDASHADIAAAIKDIADLPTATKTLAEPWVQQVNARNAALAASQPHRRSGARRTRQREYAMIRP